MMNLSTCDNVYVLLSLVIAILASYTAINIASRITTTRGLSSALWFVGGSLVIGIGILSTHFIGALAFKQSMVLAHILLLTGLSLSIAIVSSVVILWLVCLKNISIHRLMLGAIVFFGNNAAIYYIGVAALLMNLAVMYIPFFFALFVLITILVSCVVLWVALQMRRRGVYIRQAHTGASLTLGCAIVGMHYTGMAAERLSLGSLWVAVIKGIDNEWVLALVFFSILGVYTIALIISMYDVRNSRLASSLKLAKSELERLALHDSLTLLPNRRLFNHRLDLKIRNANLRSERFALMFMDLDGFKAVNDTYGHHIGDQLLVEVANRINETRRTQDTAARLGGDEFVLLIAPGEPNDVMVLAKDLVNEIKAPYILGGEILNISVSIGIAMFPADGLTEHDLMISADSAMYHAKKHARESYCFFEKSMSITSQQQLRLLLDLRKALDNNEFVLFFQPKVRAPLGEIVGVEALLRWIKKDVGLMLPDQFLPLAERTGLIAPIGNWLINEACRQMAEWHVECKGEWNISVNISTVQLSDVGIVNVVSRALELNCLSPKYLILEVTESTAMRDAEASLLILDQLAALGVSISIDDFGTGFSSLAYLKRLPASELKIDREFIFALTKGNEDAAIISAILALSKTLGLNVVAEGVETLEQQEILTDLGCTVLQGYLFGKPMGAEDMLETLRMSSV